MRYADIKKMDIANGVGCGVAVFVQGCPIHCDGCFNEETWDFSGGNIWTKETRLKVIELLNKPWMKRLSILGGEPLAIQNADDVLELVKEVRRLYPEKSIWLYTGYTYEEKQNNEIVKNVNVVVDGPYIEKLHNVGLAFRGSSNQRIIDVAKSQLAGGVVLMTRDVRYYGEINY